MNSTNISMKCMPRVTLGWKMTAYFGSTRVSMSVGQVTRWGSYLVYLDADLESLDTRLLVKLSRAKREIEQRI